MGSNAPLGDDIDPKYFVKKVETDLVFNSDGEPEFHGNDDINKDFSSTIGRIVDDTSAHIDQTSEVQKLLEGSFNPEDQLFTKESKINYQYQDLSLKNTPTIPDKGRKFSGIYEDDYFMFVEDYDKFIGEFVSDDKVKVVRGFLNNNEYNRIYYTRMTPTEMSCANLLIVHGFGHTVKYLDVSCSH